MLDTHPKPCGDEKRYDQAIENCERSILWSYWALGLGLGALAVPASTFAKSVRDDASYARMMVEVYKMMLLDRVGASVRENVATDALGRIRQELQACGLLPYGNPLDVPIDYSLLPLACGIDAIDINSLRPDQQLLRLPG